MAVVVSVQSKTSVIVWQTSESSVLLVEGLRVNRDLQSKLSVEGMRKRLSTPHLVLSRASQLPALLLELPPELAIFFQPLQRDVVQLSVRPSSLDIAERPRRGQRHKRSKAHVRNMRGEIVQSIEDVGSICLTRERGARRIYHCHVQTIVAPRSSLSSLRNLSRSSRTRTSRSTVTLLRSARHIADARDYLPRLGGARPTRP